MPVFKVNAGRDGTLDYDSAAFNAALAMLPKGAPVVVLIHGYKFSPASPYSDPHAHILSLTPQSGCWKAVSWPRHLGFGRDTADEGLCIAFGWEARGTIWQAWGSAQKAGIGLALLVKTIRHRRPDPVHMLGHSLGARVALSALGVLPANSIARLVLLAAAEFQGRARDALASPAGQSAEVINVTTRENDFFDSLLEWLVGAARRGDRALGAGLGYSARNWLDVQIDCAETRATLGRLGFRIAAPSRRICHWSPYLRPGLFGFYAGLIRRPQDLSVDRLRRVLPDRSAPRWSRLLRLPSFRLSVPGWQHARRPLAVLPAKLGAKNR